MASARPRPARGASVLLSWDRLGFRCLVFGALAVFWTIQAYMAGNPLGTAAHAEVRGICPWVLVAPIVLWWDRRARVPGTGVLRFLRAHVVGLFVVFVPYWAVQRGVDVAWTACESGWREASAFLGPPSLLNLLSAFCSIPFAYLLVLLGAEAMRQAEGRREEELQGERLAGQLSEARLALLQRQLHPHFLFNALQAISTLLHRDPATADRLLVRLSGLLRTMLDDASEQTLTLRTELDLTRRYLELEQVRFGDRLSVEWAVDDSVLEAEVPSLVMLPLVENAVRHGLSPKLGPGRLSIGVTRDGDTLVLSVEDDGLGTAMPLGRGVGIANTRERLRALFGGAAALDIDTRPGAGFRARIRMPLQERAA